MSDVHELRDPVRLKEEASAWIARVQADDASGADHALLQAWLAEHPQHRRAFEEIVATWHRFERAGPLVRTLAAGRELERVPRRSWLLRYAAAPATVVTIALAVFGWQWVTSRATHDSIRTNVGEQASLSLSDGSKVVLNTDSLVRVEYGPAARVLRLLRGEAHFVVAHDPGRPFWVAARGTWIRAVGTAFDVYITPRQVEVSVVEGRVLVTADRTNTGATPAAAAPARAGYSMVSAGEKLQSGEGLGVVRAITALELQRLQAWHVGKLVFADQPLREVVSELSRYTTLQIVIEDESLREVRVGGTFHAGEAGARALLGMLEDGWDVEVRQDGSGYVRLSRRAD